MNPAQYTTLQKLFISELAKAIFSKNDFLKLSRDWSKFAKGIQVVWNQSGTVPRVVINNDTQALVAARRDDVSRSFTLDEYQTEPNRLDWTEELLINYDKRGDILEQHLSQIAEDIAMRILARWATGSTLVRTTGATRAAGAPGATGVRKSVTYKDIITGRKAFVKSKIALDPGKLNMLIPADMEEDIMNLAEFKNRDYSSQNAESSVITGQIGRIANFNVFVRDKALITDNSGVIQLPKGDDTWTGRTGVTGDNQGILMWHSDYVVRAAPKDQLVSIIPEHGGVEMSVTAIAGGSPFYSDKRGIVMLVEEA